MSILVRSHAGDRALNDTTPDVDSPSSITAGDLLLIILLTNDDDPAGAITPPSGFTEQSDYTDASTRTRQMSFTKTADATDASNQGTANYYTFSGFNSSDDTLFGCLSLYDSVSGVTPVYTSDVRAEDATGGTNTTAGNTTITADDTMVINAWSAHGGSDYFNMNSSNSITNGGQVDTKLSGGWTNNGFSGSQWVVYSHEVDIVDSVFAARLNYTSITADGRGEMVVSYLIDAGASSGGIPAIVHHRKLMGAQ
jgi:hypothetical protein